MLRFLAFSILAAAVLSAPAAADSVDSVVHAEMQKDGIPGLSLAVIEGGRVVRAQGYGLTEKGGKTPVSSATLFQAGSVSKPVAALAALHLVEQGRLSLDEDVNRRLRTWKVPENEFTRQEKVT